MKLLRCCKLNVLQWRIQPKYFLCVVFLTLHMWNLLHGLNDYATALGYRIHPWIFPFLPDTNWNFTVMLLLFVLMICDAPFRNGQQQFVLLRVGKQRWIAAQLLYLLFLSVLFTVFLWVLSWVFLWPNLEWAGDWGKVLQTAARTGAHGDYANVILSPQMIKGTTPAVVTVWTGCMMIGVCFLLGEVVLLCNLWCQKGLGTCNCCGACHCAQRDSYVQLFPVLPCMDMVLPCFLDGLQPYGTYKSKYAVLCLWDRYGFGFEHPTGDAEYCYSPSM